MAAPVPMELSDSSELNKRHGPLAVNKSSGKIGKGIRRPVAQPRPAPTVYKIEAGEFRSLVQELTGTATTEPAIQKPSANSRLQKIAPPPLRPTFSYPKLVQPSQQLSNGMHSLPSPTNGQRYPNMLFTGFGSALSPLSQRISPFPMLSPHTFSPLPALSPSDQMWASSLESPSSAAMRHLAQSMATHENQQAHQAGNTRSESGGVGGAPIQSSFPPLSPSSFSLSPRFPSQYPNLPSPAGLGMASGFGISNIYQLGVMNSPTAGLAMEFAFPEPDFVSTGFS